MKKNFLFLLTLLTSLVACGTQKPSSSGTFSDFSSVGTSEVSSEKVSSMPESSSEKESSFSSSISSIPDSSSTPSSSSSSSENTSSSTPSEEKTQKEKAYAYEPKIPDVVPEIKISTADTKWVTAYNRQSKLNNQIEYVDAKISTAKTDSKYIFSDAPAQVKVRGNYTLDYEKKPIRIKFEAKRSMFGLNDDYKAKSWVLLANWKDLSMQNNSTAFYLGQTILGSDGYYCSDYMNVHVYINNMYWGLYLLAEQQEVKSGRINISEPEDIETEIGYLVEYDHYYEFEDPNNGGDYTFECNYGGKYPKKENGSICEPYNIGYTIKSDINSDAQVTKISNYLYNAYLIAYYAIVENRFYKMNDTYSGLVGATLDYQNAFDCINKYIDVQSMVDYYIISEILCDSDVDSSSWYMDCDLNPNSFKRLTFEAPWDYDTCMGIKDNQYAEGIYAANSGNPWYCLFAMSDWFMTLVSEKWAEIKEYKVFENSLNYINVYKTKYESAFKQNYDRWPKRITDGNFELFPILNTYKSEAEAADYQYRWLTKRYEVLDGFFKDAATKAKEKEEENEFMKTAQKYRLEAENAELKNNAEIKTGNNSSGGKYIGQISTSAGNDLYFNFNSSAESVCYVYFGISKMNRSATLSDWFDLTINDKPASLFSDSIPLISGSEEEWHAWTSVRGAKISLQKGQNVLKVLSKASTYTNIDYLDLYTKVQLTY